MVCKLGRSRKPNSNASSGAVTKSVPTQPPPQPPPPQEEHTCICDEGLDASRTYTII